MRGIEHALDFMENMTKQSSIYMASEKSTYPRPIKYFGKNITSGLHSYESYDKVSFEASATQSDVDFSEDEGVY